jgi:hypothetical protein
MFKVIASFVIFLIGFTVSEETVDARKVPENLRCEDKFTVTALAASGRKARLRQVDYVMWRESRCRNVAFNPNDPWGGSYGLFQINSYWCKPNSYSRRGWLQQQGVLKECNELFNPLVNANAFIAIFDYAEQRYGNGWIPWGGKPRWT